MDRLFFKFEFVFFYNEIKLKILRVVAVEGLMGFIFERDVFVLVGYFLCICGLRGVVWGLGNVG